MREHRGAVYCDEARERSASAKGDQEVAMWRALAAQGNGLPSSLATPEALRSALTAEKTTVWIDFFEATPEEVQLLGETFMLDPLTLEDCVNDLHHPKIDDFDRYLYLVVHGVKAGSRRGEMRTVELDVVIEKNALVTFRHEEMRSVSETWQKSATRPGFLAHGPVPALQSILSVQADHYIDEVEALQQEIHALETVVLGERRPEGFERQVFAVKRDIAHLRQILGSQRELVHRIGRGDFPEVPKRTCMVFRDVYDHLYRATEMLDTLRDLSMALLETHLAIVANRTNSVMRVLTTVATFILPLTLVTGWFGMNFHELSLLDIAHPDRFVLALFAAVSVLMALILRRGGWM
jgi:magnesium transporter